MTAWRPVFSILQIGFTMRQSSGTVCLLSGLKSQRHFVARGPGLFQGLLVLYDNRIIGPDRYTNQLVYIRLYED